LPRSNEYGTIARKYTLASPGWPKARTTLLMRIASNDAKT
jgi:hypothetical protein